ncbi:DUF4344 domain-containing metallopeptidase [Kitasatospora purpeofusca]|uniref:DUF4344 domain-containing metallopeptidase n=1 Tax=Kitasatospora purpeofusca TaxID=67352 RepID=UPI0039B951E4
MNRKAQRFSNWMCWLYGSDPDQYAPVVATERNPDGILPPEPAAGCPGEFQQMEKSLSPTLKPCLKTWDPRSETLQEGDRPGIPVGGHGPQRVRTCRRLRDGLRGRYGCAPTAAARSCDRGRHRPHRSPRSVP